MKKHAPMALAAILLASCTVGPDYAGPPDLAGTSAPQPEFVRRSEGVSLEQPTLASWWTALGDPVLTRLEQLALADNPGLEAARARVEQARASVRQERANRYPTAGAQATSIQANLPGLDLGSGPSQPGQPQQDEDETSLSFYNLGLNANWEIDLAGGQRRKIEAANALAAAAVENAADAQVQLTAEVAQTYANLRERQLRVTALEGQRALQERTLQLAAQRYERGTIPLFALGQANNELQAILADLAAAEADAAVYLDALAVLTGQAPGALDAYLAAPAAIPLPPESVAVGDPASLIRRRPDIRAAERNLAAATARIGVAEAARFPKISFMGILGIGGTSPDDILDLGNISAIAIPQLQWGLLDFGRTAAGIDQAEAARDEAEAQYEEIVLRALQDAEASLARFAQQRRTVAALAQIAQSATRAAELDRQRYEAGVISLGDLNASERQKLAAEARLNAALAALSGSYIAIQKSLGLGWGNPTEGVQ
ncbi:efflux transporter outer membrane subunit [Altererythrobacter lauratis]|uniref:Efflux transporter outer membrane subunit n=1 Tax=Alteraurantiacibacter lauratis TaxID=2054627 RepID=A0ABV7EEV4_9SPHN